MSSRHNDVSTSAWWASRRQHGSAGLSLAPQGPQLQSRTSRLSAVAGVLLALTSGPVLTTQVFAVVGLTVLACVAVAISQGRVATPVFLLVTTACALFVAVNALVFPSNLGGHAVLALKIIAASLIISTADVYRLSRSFVSTVTMFAVASFPFYVWGLLAPGVIRAQFPLSSSWGQDLRITPLYVYPDYVFSRNQGVYWEPGAFQVFLNVALLGTLLLPGLRYRGPRAVVLVVCLITTFSTSGYIATALTLAAALALRGGRLGYWLPAGLVAVGITIGSVLSSGVVQTKFASGNDSFERRVQDTSAAWTLFLERPVLGWGYQNNEILQARFGLPDSSNSLLSFGYQFGAVALLVVLFVSFRSISKMCGGRTLASLCLFAVFIIQCSVENILLQPATVLLIMYTFATASSGRGLRSVEVT